MALSVAVIIAAGGQGRRMGGPIPKQFMRLADVPILQHTLEVFDSLPEIREITVAAPRGYLRRVRHLAVAARLKKAWRVIAGGRERQDSVWNGLRFIDKDASVVLVHDAVRPLVKRETVRAVIRSAVRYGAAAAAVPVKDTVKLGDGRGFFTLTLNRENLWAVQTPQAFRTELLLEAHRQARKEGFVGTDESSLVEHMGERVRIVVGDDRNFKITTADDLAVARILAKKGKK